MALCTEENCHENINILSQKITIFTRLGRTKDALDLCTEENCAKNPVILAQKIKILLKQQRKKEALFLCEQNKQKPVILSLYQSILETTSTENLNQKESTSNDQKRLKKSDVSERIMMLAHLYHNTCTISMIENSSLSTWKKIMLKIGYYERNHSKKAVLILKKEIAENQFDKKQLKQLKQSLERVKSPSAYFDIAYYNHLLCGKNIVVFPKLEQEKTQVTPKTITEPLINDSPAKKEKPSKAAKHYVTSIELATAQSAHEKNMVKKQNKKEKLEKNSLLLKDVYRKRIYRTQLKLYKYLYMEKTKEQALRAWDYIEELKNRPATEENKELLLRLLIK